MIKTIRNSLLTATAVVAMMPSAPVQAADLYDAPASYNWTGLYGGALLGYGWGKGKANLEEYKEQTGGGFEKECIKSSGGDFKFSKCGNAGLDPTGFFGGVEVGFNQQMSNDLVIGLEADVMFGELDDDHSEFNIKTSDIDASKQTAFDFTADTEIDLAGTIRGRLGMPVGEMKNTLLYVTGGGAWAFYQANAAIDKYKCGSSRATCPDFEFDKSDPNFSRDGALVGYAVGFGVEHAFSENVTAKIEYLYTDYMADITKSGGKSKYLKFVNDYEIHSVRAGLNVFFGR